MDEKFRGVSKHGLYGDSVEEMDDSIGQILSYLRAINQSENTFVYFTSDHGPANYMRINGNKCLIGSATEFVRIINFVSLLR